MLSRVVDLFDEADKTCAPVGSTGRRARYFDASRTVLATYRDKLRWIRDWYVTRTQPENRAGPRYGEQAQAYYRGEGGGKQAAAQPAAAGAMDVDYGNGAMQQAPVQQALPVELLDEGFWQAMFDWSWNGANMDFQLSQVQG